MLNWSIEKIYNMKWKRPWKDGYAHFGFHGKEGQQYVINTEFNWVGCINEKDELVWSAGPKKVKESNYHMFLDINVPNSGYSAKDGSVLIASEANSKIFKIEPDKGNAYELVDVGKLGIGYIGSCECDLDGNIWVIELVGYRIWKLSSKGEPLLCIGKGRKGFQRGTVGFEDAEFNFMSCIKCGPDGNLYLVDSGNYSIRRINTYECTVTTVVGTGKPGYTGDGGDAVDAELGKGDYHIRFYEGPWYLTVDNKANIYIADTGNNVVRFVDKKTNTISTILGNHNVDRTKRISPDESNLFDLNLPYLVGIEYFDDRLYVTDWRGDLVILKNNILST